MLLTAKFPFHLRNLNKTFPPFIRASPWLRVFYRVTMEVRDYFLLTLFWKFYNLAQLQNRADGGTTKSKSTKLSLWPPCSHCSVVSYPLCHPLDDTQVREGRALSFKRSLRVCAALIGPRDKNSASILPPSLFLQWRLFILGRGFFSSFLRWRIYWAAAQPLPRGRTDRPSQEREGARWPRQHFKATENRQKHGRPKNEFVCSINWTKNKGASFGIII